MPNKKMGRPEKLNFKSQLFNDEEQNKELLALQSLCSIQCTLEEISCFFRVSVDTIERHIKKNFIVTFAEYYKKYSAGGKISLRRSQFKMAKTNVSMAIWLGKQYLGQADTPMKDDVDLAEGFDIKIEGIN